MRIAKNELLEDLIARTDLVLADCARLKELSEEELNHQPVPGKWSPLECLEHLNRYGDFYLPEIEKRLNNAAKSDAAIFKSGMLGNYFAKSMLPDAKAMHTFKNMNPSFSSIRKDTLDTFINQQNRYRKLLEKAKDYNLNGIKTSISISKLIKLKLGDTFRVVIYHNQRHMEQAKRALASFQQ